MCGRSESYRAVEPMAGREHRVRLIVPSRRQTQSWEHSFLEDNQILSLPPNQQVPNLLDPNSHLTTKASIRDKQVLTK